MGRHFSAGIAMSEAVYMAWGQPPLTTEALQASLADFRNAVTDNPNGSLQWIASIHKLRQQLGLASWLFNSGDMRTARTQIRELGIELCESLLLHYRDSERAENYLVRGICVATDLDGEWVVEFPQYEVPIGGESLGQKITLNIPSAFHILVDNSDWQRAHHIVEKHPNAFTSAGLKGWKSVVLANLSQSRSVELLDEAADAFASDQPPTLAELQGRGGCWTSINPELWAKYFRARARLLEAIRTPSRVKELLANAAEIIGNAASGWQRSDVGRFRVLVNTLNKLVSDDPPSISAEQAREDYISEIRMSGDSGESEEEDQFALMFIHEAATALHGFETNPTSEVTKAGLAKAVDALARVPIIGLDIAEAVRPALGDRAMRAILGPIRTWMHRSLENINDEVKLRAILLRLLQAGLPLYAQLRHGPLEYGKDVVVLVEDNKSVVLRHYQVKCGDIDKKKWRESKEELEEMFLVPLESLQLPSPPAFIEGILVTNGHANPFVAPVMDAWFREQRERSAHVLKFMNLDQLVAWITDSRLMGELRAALAEQGISILSV